MQQVARFLTLVPVAVSSVAFAGAPGGGIPPAPSFEQLLCWGGSVEGPCAVPTIENTISVSSVSLGFAHGIALLSNGTILSWGSNSDGQSTPPTFGAGLTVVEVGAGSTHTLARLSDGTVVAWGSNTFGQLNVPNFGGATAFHIAAGENHSLAELSTGEVVVWGFNLGGQATVPGAVVDPNMLSAGFDHSAALMDNGTIICWGDNTQGECDVPALAGGEAYISVACGRNFTIAQKLDGTVVAWGDAAYTSIPAVPGGSSVVEVGGKFVNAYFVTNDDIVTVWGDNNTDQSIPPNFRPFEIKSVAVGYEFLVADVEADCNENDVSDRLEVAADPTLDCDNNAELDSCTLTDDPTLDCNLNGILDVCDIDGDELLDCDANGRFDSCEITADPTLDCDDDGILDSCEIADDETLDCDRDGDLDACSASETGVVSNTISPINGSSVITASGVGRADPIFDVRVEVTVKADLGSFGEWMVLSLNDTIIDYMFVSGGANCPTASDMETVLIDKELWKGLAPDGDVTLTLRPTSLVSSVECPSSSAKLTATWKFTGSDCNGNGTPDLCEVQSGDVPDSNKNGIPDTCEYVANDDLDGDGYGDIIWWNPTARLQSFWMMSGTTRLEDGALAGGPAANANLVGFGDFDGDARSDTLYYNTASGRFSINMMDGNSVAESIDIAAAGVPAAWQVIGTPDLNGDGNADIALRNSSTKAVNGWIMNGAIRTANGLIKSSTGLKFDAIGDFDGDGDDDFLWRATDGTARVWLMSGLTVSSDAVITSSTTVAQLPLDVWTCKGAGDFDGNKAADIVWRRNADGKAYVWFMDGINRESSAQITPEVTTAFDIEAIIDTDGDMKSDLIWRNLANGDTFVWLMDGATKRSSELVRRVGLPWQILNR